MSTSATNPTNINDHAWRIEPEAATFVRQLLETAVAESAELSSLADRMHNEAGTRLLDWTYAITLGAGDQVCEQLTEMGFASDDQELWRHPGGIFPCFRLAAGEPGAPLDVAIQVESADDFAQAHRTDYDVEISGKTGDRCRVGRVRRRGTPETTPTTTVIERHGLSGVEPFATPAQQVAHAAKHRAQFTSRRRDQDDLAEGFSLAVRLVEAAGYDLHPDWATDLFFEAERDYWMRRNQAARVQYQRQQQLGLGWANHDHHTYRSSRQAFHLLVDALEQMGFACRERFYAGREAGWGAQVLEHRACGLVVFADVDLSPEEVSGDFAHEPLPDRAELGTVGLWCRLHGESFLTAGMHHLECQFDFNAARRQLADAGIETMAPFTDFPHLKQAFTCGEMWPVSEKRLEDAVAASHITPEQADMFRRDGALGSHMEILERNDGYKGFNQTGISEIITRTDPRRSESGQ